MASPKWSTLKGKNCLLLFFSKFDPFAEDRFLERKHEHIERVVSRESETISLNYEISLTVASIHCILCLQDNKVRNYA